MHNVTLEVQMLCVNATSGRENKISKILKRDTIALILENIVG